MEKPRTQFTMRIEPELLRRIDEAAKEDGMSRTAYIVTKLKRTLPRKAG